MSRRSGAGWWPSLVLPVLLVACGAPAPSADGSVDRWRDGLQRVVVVGHTDGDTIRLELDEDGVAGEAGTELAARLLEIDAPESGGPYRDEECFGQEAAAALAGLMPVGSTAWAERDEELRDRYGRTLVYLYVERGGEPDMVNLRLVREGHAEVILVEPNDRHIDQMRDAETRAQEQRRGLWASC